MSIRKPDNNIVSNTVDGLLKGSRDKDDNIIISGSTLRSLLPPQLKKNRQDTRSCVVANVAYLPILYIPNYCHGEIVIKKKLKDISQNSQNRRSRKKANSHI